MRIERVDVRRLAVPLTRPYRLAFGPVTQYDTILVDITGDDGQRGFGEATLLTGYTDETIDDSERLAYATAANLPGTAAAEACNRMHDATEIRQRAQDLFGAYVGGNLRVTIDRVVPLADAAQAHRVLESRESRGKLLLAA